MTKIKFSLYLIKGLIIIGLTAVLILKIPNLLLVAFDYKIPNSIYQMVIVGGLLGAVWLGSGDFIKRLKDEHKNKNKQIK